MASYIVFERKNGSFFSQTIWSNGVDSLPPEADMLALGSDPETKNFLMVPWKHASSLLHDLMKRHEGLVPIRYRVRTFPGTDRIEKLRIGREAANT